MRRGRPTLYKPKPYPTDWVRRFGFYAPMGLEVAAGAGDLELFHLVAETSVKAGVRPPSEDIKGEFGILKRHPVYRDKLIYVKNTTLDPLSKDREVVSQKDLVEEIAGLYHINYVGDFPDIITKERGVIEKIPNTAKISEAPEVIQASDEFISYQSTVGNFTKKWLRFMPGARGVIKDWYYPIRGELWDYAIIPPGYKSHPILKKLRSAIRTDSAFTDASGWSGLGNEGIRIIEEAIVKNRLPWDLGVPIRFIGKFDGTPIHGQVYHLLKRDFKIAVEAVSELEYL
jgi:hypothetical protein